MEHQTLHAITVLLDHQILCTAYWTTKYCVLHIGPSNLVYCILDHQILCTEYWTTKSCVLNIGPPNLVYCILDHQILCTAYWTTKSYFLYVDVLSIICNIYVLLVYFMARGCVTWEGDCHTVYYLVLYSMASFHAPGLLKLYKEITF